MGLDDFINSDNLNDLVDFFVLKLLSRLYDKKDEYVGNLVFLFEEENVRKLLIERIDTYLVEYDNFRKKELSIVKRYINNPFLSGLPIIRINNFKDFIFLIRDIYNAELDRLGIFSLSLYEDELFADLWLRASPLDLADVNGFLRKQLEMYHDNTFNQFERHQKIADFPSLNMFMMAKTKVCMTYDECPSEMIFRFYSNSTPFNYYSSEFYKLEKEYYELPRIRYGIYEENGRKICRIGSIQDKNSNRDISESDKNVCEYMAKRINRFKYGIIKKDDNHVNVEPNKIIALVLFLFYLFKNGITRIEMPMMYFNNSTYHIKERKRLEKEQEKVTCNENTVSELKTEKLFLTVLKTIEYFENASILDLDNRILVDTGNINLTNNQFILDLYQRLEDSYQNIISNRNK